MWSCFSHALWGESGSATKSTRLVVMTCGLQVDTTWSSTTCKSCKLLGRCLGCVVGGGLVIVLRYVGGGAGKQSYRHKNQHFSRGLWEESILHTTAARCGYLRSSPSEIPSFHGTHSQPPLLFHTVNTLTAATLSNNRTPSSELVQNPSGSSAQPTSPWSKTW